MAKDIRMPKLGQTMEEGTIVTTLVKVGDTVKKGDIIFEVETDKATMEVDCPAEGFVKAILAEVGQTLPVNAPILVLGDKDETVPQSYIDALLGGAVAPAPAPVVSAPAAPAAAQPSPQQPQRLRSQAARPGFRRALKCFACRSSARRWKREPSSPS